MRVRGHTLRILGNVLTVVGSVALGLGVVSSLAGLLIINDAASDDTPNPNREDLGDLVEGLVLGGMVAGAIGLATLVVGLVLRGVGKALAERAQRLDAQTAAAPAADS